MNRPFRADDRGTAIVEFAIIVPILLTLIFGMIEFGVAFNRAQAIEAAAREGARLASISTTDKDAIDARVTATLAGLPIANVAVQTSPATSGSAQPCDGREGQEVLVTVSGVHQATVPLILTTDLTLQAQAVFRCEA